MHSLRQAISISKFFILFPSYYHVEHVKERREYTDSQMGRVKQQKYTGQN